MGICFADEQTRNIMEVFFLFFFCFLLLPGKRETEKVITKSKGEIKQGLSR